MLWDRPPKLEMNFECENKSFMNAKYFWTTFNNFSNFASRQGDFEMPLIHWYR